MGRIKQTIKTFLPATLFGRALLILVLPVVLVQIFAIYMFYERHWDSIVRNMSSTLAGEIMLLVREFESTPPDKRVKHTTALGEMLGIGVFYDRSQERVFVSGKGAEEYPEFYDLLSGRIAQPFMVQRVPPEGDIEIAVLMDNGTLVFHMTKKRLVSSTTYIFLLWMVGSALILLIISILFLRNQIRPIRQLAEAAKRFGMGQDMPGYSPRGATEVRQAGHAFVTMRDRIQRQVSTRTEMLAGISHDLRTPLTRLRLQLAMLGLDDSRRAELESDLEAMEHMIQEYLDFARGEGREQTETVMLAPFLKDIVVDYQHHEEPVTLQHAEDGVAEIRPKAMRRALQNVIDNAIRYGEKADIAQQAEKKHWLITITDDGPGIPESEYETVFRPFTRLDPSRNIRTGGAGLGLSIARDVVQAHGGTIELENRPHGGLTVIITLPR